jgi:hypothetical protein
MTNLEAIQATVGGYPLSDNVFTKALIDRGISAAGVYSGKSEGMELATADVYMVLVTAANVAEGGFQVSVTDKSNFLRMAESIYQKYGDAAGTGPRIRSMTQRW